MEIPNYDTDDSDKNFKQLFPFMPSDTENHSHFCMWINQKNSLQKTSLIIYAMIKMGIFNEHSYNNPFARGIQGAQGVGFNLTSDGNYDMVGKKLTNVGDGVSPSDAVTRKQLDSSGFGDITADIDLKKSYNIQNSKKRTFNQLSRY